MHASTLKPAAPSVFILRLRAWSQDGKFSRQISPPAHDTTA